MPPELRREGMGYVLCDPASATEMIADRIARTRGDVYAHVSIRCGLPGTRSRSGHLHAARLNLSSSSARATLARVLKDRANIPGLDWMDLLEEFCRGVLDAEREGEPIVMVGALPRVAGGIAYRLDPLVPINMPAILYAEGGVGKSTLAAAFAVSCESGAEIVPGFIPRRCRTLYLDWESDQGQINERVAGVAMGANLPHVVTISYRPMVGPLSDSTDELARFVDREKIGLVVVDSIGPASGGSSEGTDASESALRLFAAFRALRTTVLAIDHVSKASLDDSTKQARPYGSIYKQNLARATWEMRRSDDRVALYHTKSNVSRLHHPMGLSVTYGDDGSIVYQGHEISATDTKLSGSLSLRDRMWRLLIESGHMEPAEIVEALDANRSSVSAELSRNKGHFCRLPSGAWEALPDPARRQAQGQTA